MDAKPTPPACFGVFYSAGFILWRDASTLVECRHRNFFCIFWSCCSAHGGDSNTAAVNNTDRNIMTLRSKTRCPTLVATGVAVARRRWKLRKRAAQFTSVKFSVPTAYPKYLVVARGWSTGMPKNLSALHGRVKENQFTFVWLHLQAR